MSDMLRLNGIDCGTACCLLASLSGLNLPRGTLTHSDELSYVKLKALRLVV